MAAIAFYTHDGQAFLGKAFYGRTEGDCPFQDYTVTYPTPNNDKFGAWVMNEEFDNEEEETEENCQWYNMGWFDTFEGARAYCEEQNKRCCPIFTDIPWMGREEWDKRQEITG